MPFKEKRDGPAAVVVGGITSPTPGQPHGPDAGNCQPDLPWCSTDILITKDNLPKGVATFNALIDYAIKHKKLISWAAIHSVRYPGVGFKNANCLPMTAEASRHHAGSDALLVDKDVRFAANAPWVEHHAWLRRNGYPCLPQVKPKKKKK